MYKDAPPQIHLVIYVYVRARALLRFPCMCGCAYVSEAWTGEVGPLSASLSTPSFLPSRTPLGSFYLSPLVRPLSSSPLVLSLFLSVSVYLSVSLPPSSSTRECPSSHSSCPDDRRFNVRLYILGIPANERISPRRRTTQRRATL